ncbi:HDOD domain-containing protein [Thiomicrorhabdus indica]|uniref:HDOD domain-containing protein n=1 Tax=Thiomicrorhabdus indica TaxID=2267253 RepID=UPI002AA7F8DC|nr:HDOD domain-containing protein [Thiomicrorhabdus indica]
MPINIQLGLSEAKKLLATLHVDSLPPEVFELQELLLTPSPNTVEVAAIISRNPELLGNFLSITNQHLRRTEGELILEARAAVNLLGLKEIENFFIASYLEKNLPCSASEQTILRRSKRAAIAASEMAYWVSDVNRTECYLCCFVQDIGSLYLARANTPSALKYFNDQLEYPLTAYHEEYQSLQTSHAFIGSILAHQWHLGGVLDKSIMLHHSQDFEHLNAYDPRLAKMIALIQLANGLVSQQFEAHGTLEYFESAEQTEPDTETAQDNSKEADQDESQYSISDELKRCNENAMAFLQLPDRALISARAALDKWGVHCRDHIASH